MLKYFVFLFAALILVVLATIRVNGWRVEKSLRKMVQELNRAAMGRTETGVSPSRLTDLPAPVQRYFQKVLPDGQQLIRRVELRQSAVFRMDERSSRELPLTARQYFTVNPPGFLWDARIKMAPLLTVRVLDAYLQGEGKLQARLFSTITVADASASSELNQGELLRWLAEAVWFPTALLPSSHLRWENVDERTARAILTDGENRVSLTFHFKISGEIVRARGIRFRLVNGSYQAIPWNARYWDYQQRGGMLIPCQAEVSWELPEGEFIYSKGKIEEIAFYY